MTTMTFQAGACDAFVGGLEQAGPGAGLTAQLEGICPGATGLLSFDEAAGGRCFGHSFSSLPAGILGAELELHLRADASAGPAATGDDRLYLQSGPQGFALEMRLGDRVPEGWNPGDTARVTVDLGQEALLDTLVQGRLDVGVGEDTAVDCLRLVVEFDAEAVGAGGCQSNPLGTAGEFNVFVRKDMEHNASEVGGRLAVGGNAILRGHSVALQDPGGDALVVGGSLDMESGTVFGDLYYGQSAELRWVHVTSGNVRQGQRIDFEAEGAYLETVSRQWNTLPVNGRTETEPGGGGRVGVRMIGEDPELNVFRIAEGVLGRAHSVYIEVPPGSTVVINVQGGTIDLRYFDFFLPAGVGAEDVLLNFPQAHRVDMRGIGVKGTVLAPQADVTFEAGGLTGALMAGSFLGSGEPQLAAATFTGCLPVPTPCSPVATRPTGDGGEVLPLELVARADTEVMVTALTPVRPGSAEEVLLPGGLTYDPQAVMEGTRFHLGRLAAGEKLELALRLTGGEILPLGQGDPARAAVTEVAPSVHVIGWETRTGPGALRYDDVYVQVCGNLAAVAPEEPGVEPGPLRENPLGTAQAFDAFVFGDLSWSLGAVDGRLAAGGNAHLQDFALAAALPGFSGPSLVVNGDLVYTSGQVFNGDVEYGGKVDLGTTGIQNGEARRNRPIPFRDVHSAVRELSEHLASLRINGEAEMDLHSRPDGVRGEIRLRGEDPELNLFHLESTELSRAESLQIIVPEGSTVLITVEGSDARMRMMGFDYSGAARERVLFHFPRAESLELEFIDIPGSILAPEAKVSFSNGSIRGLLVAGQLSGAGHVAAVGFEGRLPVP